MSMVIKIGIEGLILSFVLYLICALEIRNGAVNMVHLYSKEVQDRAIELGLTTREKIKKTGKRFKLIGLLFYFGYTILCVYVINGARGFLPSFLQFVAILWIMGVFDRIVVDLRADDAYTIEKIFRRGLLWQKYSCYAVKFAVERLTMQGSLRKNIVQLYYQPMK